MYARRLRLVRDVTRHECDWLGRDYKEGEFVYEYGGATYGCISPNGVACTEDVEGREPFFELPDEAVEVM